MLCRGTRPACSVLAQQAKSDNGEVGEVSMRSGDVTMTIGMQTATNKHDGVGPEAVQAAGRRRREEQMRRGLCCKLGHEN